MCIFSWTSLTVSNIAILSSLVIPLPYTFVFEILSWSFFSLPDNFSTSRKKDTFVQFRRYSATRAMSKEPHIWMRSDGWKLSCFTYDWSSEVGWADAWSVHTCPHFLVIETHSECLLFILLYNSHLLIHFWLPLQPLWSRHLCSWTGFWQTTWLCLCLPWRCVSPHCLIHTWPALYSANVNEIWPLLHCVTSKNKNNRAYRSFKNLLPWVPQEHGQRHQCWAVYKALPHKSSSQQRSQNSHLPHATRRKANKQIITHWA